MSQIIPQIRQQGTTRFDFLGGCLPGRAAPTDIDQAIERNGHFLFIECKRPGQRIPQGQAILFDVLIAVSHKIRLLIVIGHPPDEILSYGWWREPQKKADVRDVRELVRAWYDWASSEATT